VLRRLRLFAVFPVGVDAVKTPGILPEQIFYVFSLPAITLQGIAQHIPGKQTLDVSGNLGDIGNIDNTLSG